jgi:competence protein ComFC
MSAFFRALLDLLYPPKCVICHRLLEAGEGPVCPACLRELPDYDGPEPGIRFAERCAVTFYYEDRLRESFLRFKFSGLSFYADTYGKWLAGTIRDKLAGQYDLVSWVPVSRARRRSRGYDQAELLCRAAAKELGAEPVSTLRKKLDTPAQSGLSGRAERAANAVDAYEAVEPARFAGLRILLIDDIVTTGATLSECARVLRTMGAAAVVCAALAAPRREQDQE